MLPRVSYALQSITRAMCSSGLCEVKVGERTRSLILSFFTVHNQRVARKASTSSFALNRGTSAPAGASLFRARSFVARSASR